MKCLLSLIVVWSAICLRTLEAQPRRNLTPSDVINLEVLGDDSEVAVSPDGHTVAFVVIRPLSSVHLAPVFDIQGFERSDVWLVNIAGGLAKARNITHGQNDNAGYWMPRWSPDSKHLAMLATEGNCIRLIIWDRISGIFTKIEHWNISLYSDELGRPPFVWLSDTQVALAAAAVVDQTPYLVRASEQLASAAWSSPLDTDRPTASTLESGPTTLMNTAAKRMLVIYDVEHGLVGTATTDEVLAIEPSPNGKIIAIIDRASSDGRRRLTIIDADGHGVGELPTRMGSVDSSTVSWSPSGEELLVTARTLCRSQARVTWFICHVSGNECRQLIVTQRGEQIRSATWLSNGRILAHLVPAAHCRNKWYVLSSDGKVTRFATHDSLPSTLVEAETGTLVGVKSNVLYIFDLDGSVRQRLRLPNVGTFSLWRAPQTLPGQPTTGDAIILTSQDAQKSEYYRFHFPDHLQTVAILGSSASLIGYTPLTEVAILAQVASSGTSLSICQGHSYECVQVKEINSFLADIAGGINRTITYHGIGGEDLRAAVTLPPDYEEGKKYPLVVDIYGGSTDVIPGAINDSSVLNVELLAAHGYVVLKPSIPLEPEGMASDPCTRITAGVMPAVDRLISLGVADENRLAVIGHSYGGYSLYCLLTQTTRFHVAISLAGFDDLISMYGTFDARTRYTPTPFDWSAFFENGWGRMGAAPWQDPKRYLRNSPLMSAYKVRTPLMIVHGDNDYVPLEQDEELFSALRRLHKRAIFVRYWGEGHLIERPANVLDLWQRMYSWLDDFLYPHATTSPQVGSTIQQN